MAGQCNEGQMFAKRPRVGRRETGSAEHARVEALVRFVGTELIHIRKNWSRLRGIAGVVEVRKIPAVENWFKSLAGDTKSKAKHWVGRINSIRSVDQRQKMELLKASVLAFEIYRRKEQLSILEEIEDHSVEQILNIFRDIDDLQLSYYGQIVNMRLGIIKRLVHLLDDNAGERELQKFLFQHLWLLVPSWERVTRTEMMGTRINKWLNESAAQLTKDERRSRINIGYRTASGQHVIIELKRKSASVNLGSLVNQVGISKGCVENTFPHR